MPASSAAQFSLLPDSIINDRYCSPRQICRQPGQIRAAARTVEHQHAHAAIFQRAAPFLGRGRGGDHRHIVVALATMRESSGMRSVESATMRSSGRLRSSPVRSVSRQSSASTVPMPVRIASALCRICCTCGAGALAGDPAGVVLRRGDFAVQCERGFQRHQRTAGAHGVDESFIQPGGFARRIPEAISTAMPASCKRRNPSPRHLRIRILHGRDHARNARFESTRRRRAACGPDANTAPA